MNTSLAIVFTAAAWCAWYQRRASRRVQERINEALLSFLNLKPTPRKSK